MGQGERLAATGREEVPASETVRSAYFSDCFGVTITDGLDVVLREIVERMTSALGLEQLQQERSCFLS